MGGGEGAIKAEMVFDVIPQIWHVYIYIYLVSLGGTTMYTYIYIEYLHTYIYMIYINIYTYKHMCIYNCNI